jgi:hypothetical protein
MSTSTASILLWLITMTARDSPPPTSLLPDSWKAGDSTRRPRFGPRLREIRLTRALGVNEAFFVALHRFTATQVTRVIALEGKLAPRTLQRALAALHTRHPLLRARLVDAARAGTQPGLVYDDVPALRLHIVPRMHEGHWRQVLEEVLNTRISYPTDSLFSVHYLYDESSAHAELILSGDHAVCDGVSMNALSAELLSLCAGQHAGAAARRLPELDTLLPSFPTHRRALGFFRSLLRLSAVTLTRQLFESRRSGEQSAYSFVALTEAQTEQLLRRARTAGTNVTGALLAAVTTALHELHPGTPRLSVSVPVNLRPRIAEHTLLPDDVGNYTSVVVLAADPRAPFWPRARRLKAALDAAAGSEGLLAASGWLYRCGRALIGPGKPPLAHAMLSNSGVVPLARDYGAFRPRAFYSATSAPLVSADLCFFCNSLHGRLSINVVFSERVVTRVDAERALGRVSSLLTAPPHEGEP